MKKNLTQAPKAARRALETVWREHRTWAYVAAGAAITVVFVVFYRWWPWWFDSHQLHQLATQHDIAEQETVLTDDRGDVLKIVGGAGGLVALFYVARRHTLDREAHALDQEGQVTDRYTRAIEQLGHDSEDVRLGGIYALGRIMTDSPRDHGTVVAVLAAYVRQHATLPEAEPSPELDPFPPTPDEIPTDVAAAVAVLGRRISVSDEPDLHHTNLGHLKLPPSARLDNADLTEAQLSFAWLAEVSLAGAVLREADLRCAFLSGVDLTRTDLTDADFGDADLSNANLAHAILAGVDLREANLMGANLEDADLQGCKVTPRQLASAHITSETTLDVELVADPWVRARFAACAAWTGKGVAPFTLKPSD